LNIVVAWTGGVTGKIQLTPLFFIGRILLKLNRLMAPKKLEPWSKKFELDQNRDIKRIADSLEKIAIILESNVHINIDHAHIDDGEIDVHSKTF
tara:strand:+ start:97 stop:378 length:282 start_codon:yes stop_codon:yes gene_type:complete